MEVDNILHVISVPLGGSQLCVLITCICWEGASVKVRERAVLDTLRLWDIMVPGRYG
jgi:hypothetical protein